jgi:ComF family protein
MKKPFHKVLELVYPAKCPLCGREILVQGERACRDCRSSVQKISGNFCLKCGKELGKDGDEFCEDCREHPHGYVQNRGLFSYTGQMKGCMYRYKYQNQRYYAEYFAKELLEAYGRQIRSWGVEAMVPVPLHPSRRRRRGFNQAELVVRYMEEPLGIPVLADYVRREKKTLPQKYLNPSGRQKNLKNAFNIAPNGVKLNRVLVFDDIYTTGSTLDAVSAVLLEAGIQDVYGLCICIGQGR